MATTTAIAGDTALPPRRRRPPARLLWLYLLLGFAAGLPFYMFNAVLLLRLARHGVDIVTVGYFGWVALLPTFKFAWAPLLDRHSVPGFGRFWGKRRGWMMLSQVGIFFATVAMAFTSSDRNLALTALFAVCLAFWTTTLEVAADAWRIELAPSAEEQGSMVAANLWGYRSAMVAAGSGAIWIAARSDWTLAYLAIAAAAFLPFPILAATRRDDNGSGSRIAALASGTSFSLAVLAVTTILSVAIGWVLFATVGAAATGNPDSFKYWVFAAALLPFVALCAAVPWITRLPPDHRMLTRSALAPYLDVAWRFGLAVIPILLFVSVYRMGDVMALTLSHPLFADMGYSLEAIAVADGAVALLSSMLGVAFGGWLAARAPMGWALAAGAVMSALSNWIFAWLAHQSPGGPEMLGAFGIAVTRGDLDLYLAMALDQFGHGFEGAVFVVYLSMLVNPRYPGAQYALLSGLAFLIPRLLAGLSGVFQTAIGYDGFFIMAGTMSLAALVFVPFIVRARARDRERLVAA
jgi:PAT family beta-lactamase induction signal transducer AmpG